MSIDDFVARLYLVGYKYQNYAWRHPVGPTVLNISTSQQQVFMVGYPHTSSLDDCWEEICSVLSTEKQDV